MGCLTAFIQFQFPIFVSMRSDRYYVIDMFTHFGSLISVHCSLSLFTSSQSATCIIKLRHLYSDSFVLISVYISSWWESFIYIFSSFLFGKLPNNVAVSCAELPSTGKYLKHEF